MRVMKQRFGAGVRQEVLGDVVNRSFLRGGYGGEPAASGTAQH
jgi:hypothetical protein